MSVKEFYFSTVIDLHIASFLNSVTHLSQIFYKEIILKGQPLNDWPLQNIVESLDQKSTQHNIHIFMINASLTVSSRQSGYDKF